MSPAERDVAAIYSRVLNVPVVQAVDDLFSLGGDSLQAIRIALELERHFGVEVTPESLAVDNRVSDVARRFASSAPSAA